MTEVEPTPFPTDVATSGSRVHVALRVPALFSRPKFVAPSPILQHLPLLFWTAEVLRPGISLTVGPADGVAHFALCQTLERLDDGGECWSIAGDDESFGEDLRRYDAQQYAEFSHLLDGPVERVAGELPEGGIDLLLLDAGTVARALDAGLVGRMSGRGVLILHGTSRAADLPEALRGHRAIAFHHGAGALLLGIGDRIPPQIETLLSANDNRKDARSIRQVFERLGRGLHAEGEIAGGTSAARDAEARAREAEDEAARLALRLAEVTRGPSSDAGRDELKVARAEAKKLAAELAKAEDGAARQARDLEAERQKTDALKAEAEALAERLAQETARKDAALQSVAPLEHELETLRLRGEALAGALRTAEEEQAAEARARKERTDAASVAVAAETARRTEAEGERDTLRAVVEELRAELAARTERVDHLEAEGARFNRELAILARKVEEADLRADNAGREGEARVQNALRQGEENARLLEQRTAELAHKSDQVEQLLASASWRVTSPMRAVSRTLRK